METTMTARRQYRKRATQTVFAIQLNLDTPGLDYQKWGGPQHAKPGDWLVKNGADTYTVDAESFAATYRNVEGATFVKTGHVWAEIATEPGSVPTKEGSSVYAAGDYLVSNQENGDDAYAVSAAKFEAMYEAVE